MTMMILVNEKSLQSCKSVQGMGNDNGEKARG